MLTCPDYDFNYDRESPRSVRRARAGRPPPCVFAPRQQKSSPEAQHPHRDEPRGDDVWWEPRPRTLVPTPMPHKTLTDHALLSRPAIAQKEQLGFDKAVEVHHVAPQTTTITPHTCPCPDRAPFAIGRSASIVRWRLRQTHTPILSPTPTRYTDHHHLHAQACRATVSRRICSSCRRASTIASNRFPFPSCPLAAH